MFQRNSLFMTLYLFERAKICIFYFIIYLPHMLIVLVLEKELLINKITERHFKIPFQAQFILCIIHCIRALSVECDFPRFLTGLLLLNASIFFVLFMNFYVQNYKKQQAVAVQKKLLALETSKAAAQLKATASFIAKKVN